MAVRFQHPAAKLGCHSAIFLRSHDFFGNCHFMEQAIMVQLMQSCRSLATSCNKSRSQAKSLTSGKIFMILAEIASVVWVIFDFHHQEDVSEACLS